MASFRLVWVLNGMHYTYGWRWVPEDTVAMRTERNSAPYTAWVEAGFIERTPGDVIDYDMIEARVIEAVQTFNVQQIAFDRWNATDLVNRLVEKNVPLVEFVQGTKSFHPAMQSLELLYLTGKLAHAGDPVLKWCVSNVVPRYDVNMNMAPDKKRAPDKIDDAVALIMAEGLIAAKAGPRRSVYEDRGILEFPG
jgi:phage terminase large subunit-like protein